MTEFNERNGGEHLDLVKIPAGSFLMGSPKSERDRNNDERQHEVVISTPFLMCRTPVTQNDWKRVMGNNPSAFKGDDLPVDSVSWFDALEFCNKLSSLEGLKPAYTFRGEEVTWDSGANGYRLPTEAEWEYACRAGTTTAYNTGGQSDLDRAGWFSVNSGDMTHPVGKKEPNAWGLHDMHGNALEWCWDWFGQYPYGTVTDPTGPSTGDQRVVRGGFWAYHAQGCRSACRFRHLPLRGIPRIGFRPARSAPQPAAPPDRDRWRAIRFLSWLNRGCCVRTSGAQKLAMGLCLVVDGRGG